MVDGAVERVARLIGRLDLLQRAELTRLLLDQDTPGEPTGVREPRRPLLPTLGVAEAIEVLAED